MRAISWVNFCLDRNSVSWQKSKTTLLLQHFCVNLISVRACKLCWGMITTFVKKRSSSKFSKNLQLLAAYFQLCLPYICSVIIYSWKAWLQYTCSAHHSVASWIFENLWAHFDFLAVCHVRILLGGQTSALVGVEVLSKSLSTVADLTNFSVSSWHAYFVHITSRTHS